MATPAPTTKRPRGAADGDDAPLARGRIAFKRPRATAAAAVSPVSPADNEERKGGQRGRDGVGGQSGKDGEDGEDGEDGVEHQVPRMEFKVPPEWAKLAKEPCRDPLPSNLKDAFFSFIHGDRTLRRVRDKYDGTLGPMQSQVTTMRLDMAQALKEHALAEATRHAGLAGGGSGSGGAVATVTPRQVGAYFHVNPAAVQAASSGAALAGGGSSLDMEVEPIMAFVRKSVKRSGAKLNFDVVKEALEGISPATLGAKVAALQASKGKSRRKKAEPPEGWLVVAFTKLMQERMHDIMYTTREDVEFRDGVPAKVMKQYQARAGGDGGDGGDVPAASAGVMSKYRQYLLARRTYQHQAEAKKRSTERGKAEMDSVKDAILQYMLQNGLRSRYLEPKIGDTKQPLFVRVKVRAPKVGQAATVKWVHTTLRECPAFCARPDGGGDTGEDVVKGSGVATFLHGSDEEVAAFRAAVLDSFRSGFKRLEQVELAPAEMYLSVDYAKPADSGKGNVKFSKVHMQ